MATRYDQKTKDEVVAFIKQYNDEKGMGGQTAASEKWGINAITLKSWLDKAGVATPGRGGKRKRKAKRAAKKTTAAAESSVAPAKGPLSKSVSGKLKRMMALQEKIEALQSEYDSLKKEI